MEEKIILETKNLFKNFGGVNAITNVNLKVREGEIVGLVGDNGAGKSTLIKMIAGVFQPSEGEILFEGKNHLLKNPIYAKNLGIETVFQDLALCDDLNVAENFFLGREINNKLILNKREMRKKTVKVLNDLNIRIDSVNKKVQLLSGGQRQGIALGKLYYWGTKLALLDEPTAALGVNETMHALELLKNLNEKKKISIIMISHNLEHVFAIVERIIVLRLGQIVAERLINETTPDEIVSFITGAKFINAIY